MPLLLGPIFAAAVSLATLQADARAHAGLLDRIERVESGGHPNPDRAVGDGGLARGRMQIHPNYYIDARRECRDLPADYRAAAADRTSSRLAVCAYWRRYGATNDRERALLHHYGPDKKARTTDRDGYAKKVGVK